MLTTEQAKAIYETPLAKLAPEMAALIVIMDCERRPKNDIPCGSCTVCKVRKAMGMIR